jgi:hypothetical protein
MSFVVLLVTLSLAMGAAAHTSMPVFLAAASAIGVWLVAFAVRESMGRRRD